MTVPQEKQMNAGVELLLKRMETHPEEFTEQGKWITIMQDIHKYAEKEESDTLNKALKALMMQKVTERVLEGLVDPKSSNGGNDQYYQNLKNTALGGATQGGYTLTSNGNKPQWVAATSASINTNTLTVGNQTLDQETIEHMKAHLDWLKREKQLQKEATKQKKISMLERILGK